VAHTCNPSYPRGRDQEDHGARQIIREILSQKYPIQKRASRVAQVVKYLSSMCEALSSNPSTTKKQQQKNNRSGSCQAQWACRFPHTWISPNAEPVVKPSTTLTGKPVLGTWRMAYHRAGGCSVHPSR
jgi:hypothetical protein